MNLPSRLLALSLEVSGDNMMKQDTREYNLIVNYMHGIRQRKAAVGLGSLTKVKRALDNKLFRNMWLSVWQEERKRWRRGPQ